MQWIGDLKDEFFLILRGKVKYSDRQQYIMIIAMLENMHFGAKLSELEKCKEEWEQSSAALVGLYKKLAIPLVHLHTDEFLSYDRLSGYQLKNISDLTGVPTIELVQELIKILTSPEWNISASIWLGLASFVSPHSDIGEAQSALSRLLNSKAAMLALNVTDGDWNKGIYPPSDIVEIAAGLVWRMLGSPYAKDRWRAAHSVRCFARFNRWSVIDALVDKYDKEDAHPFQAPELPFYFLHARLWLLIALARVALNSPKEVAKYRDILFKITQDNQSPHVLMRHFASQTLLTCFDNDLEIISDMELINIRKINISPFPHFNHKIKNKLHEPIYGKKPGASPNPEIEFSLDYDFAKNDVRWLSDVFGKPYWEVKDMVGKSVREYDINIKSMNETDGRTISKIYNETSEKLHFPGAVLC